MYLFCFLYCFSGVSVSLKMFYDSCDDLCVHFLMQYKLVATFFVAFSCICMLIKLFPGFMTVFFFHFISTFIFTCCTCCKLAYYFISFCILGLAHNFYHYCWLYTSLILLCLLFSVFLVNLDSNTNRIVYEGDLRFHHRIVPISYSSFHTFNSFWIGL